ncbi:MAG: elongation factor P [Terriglobales bacterium]
MAALTEALNIKRKSYLEFENIPYVCMDKVISTPTARGGQTLVRLKLRNLLTQAVGEKTFKAGDRFKAPDLETIAAAYLYSDAEGSYFLDQVSFETVSLTPDQVGDDLKMLTEGAIVQIEKYKGNPLGLVLPIHVELTVVYAEPAVRGDTSSGATKTAKLETGAEIRVPLFVKEGDKVKVTTETREFHSRA